MAERAALTRMLRNLLFALLTLCASCAFAATDINTADQATLESVKGIGTDLSGRILDERRKSPFRDWADLMRRVKGIGASSAAKLSAAGLTVNGAPYEGTPQPPLRPPSAARN
jgi:competence protein ComEA